MSYQKHTMSAVIDLNPVEAKRRIVDVLRRHGMHMESAAVELGCAYNTLIRWLERLDLDVDAMRARARTEGWHHDKGGGRPIGSTVAAGAAPRGSKAPVVSRRPASR